MSDRKLERELERYLDGEISRAELPEALRLEEGRLEALMASVRVEESAPASLRESVMREILADPAASAASPATSALASPSTSPAWKRAWEWFARPRTVSISPAYGGLALAAALALLFLLPNGQAPVEEGPAEGGITAATTAETGTERVVTRFVLVAPQASSVSVTGAFAGWDPEGVALTNERGTGVWVAEVALPPGVHEYAFVVDGSEWRPDPYAATQVDDGFGRQNSLLMVPAAS